MQDTWLWARQRRIAGAATAGRPSLAAFGGRLTAVWSGAGGDAGLFWSSCDGRGWTPPARIAGVSSEAGPGLVSYRNRLHALWPEVGQSCLSWSSFDGTNWAPQQVTGLGAGVRPALAAFGGLLYAAWRGVGADQRLYWSSFDGVHWAPRQALGGASSADGPSLAEFDGRLYAAWTGVGGNSGIHWSSFDGSTWGARQSVGGAGASAGPALGAGGGRLYAVWRGVSGDGGLVQSSFSGGAWSEQQPLAGMVSRTGPALAAFGAALQAVWAGPPGDDGITWSTLFDETATDVKLAFVMQDQAQANWCWAAVSTSLSRFYNGASAWTQCLAANQQLGQTTCCADPGAPGCNQSGYLDKALSAMGNLDERVVGTVPGPMLDGDVLRALPVAVRIAWAGGGGHFVVVTGSANASGLLHVQDPTFGTSDIAYDMLATAYQGTGFWTHTYFSKP